MAPRPKRRQMKPVSEAIRKWAQALAGRQETTLKSAFGSLRTVRLQMVRLLPAL